MKVRAAQGPTELVGGVGSEGGLVWTVPCLTFLAKTLVNFTALPQEIAFAQHMAQRTPRLRVLSKPMWSLAGDD